MALSVKAQLLMWRLLKLFCSALALTLQGCAAQEKSNSFPPRRQLCKSTPNQEGPMHCGKGVPMCGVLTLETGHGAGAYHHKEPVVHGLWPQVRPFGDSLCVAPRSRSPPQVIYSCYKQEGESLSQLLGFERHEFETHGICAGGVDAADFFDQVCQLSEAPLQVMTRARAAGLDLVDTIDTLQRQGFCVWRHGTNDQVELSVCAGEDGRWKLADIVDFERECGQLGTTTSTSQPSAVEQCLHGQRGPMCKSNDECYGRHGCVRCARSGFCTDVPLLSDIGSNELTAETISPNIARTKTTQHPAMLAASVVGLALATIPCVCVLAFRRRVGRYCSALKVPWLEHDAPGDPTLPAPVAA